VIVLCWITWVIHSTISDEHNKILKKFYNWKIFGINYWNRFLWYMYSIVMMKSFPQILKLPIKKFVSFSFSLTTVKISWYSFKVECARRNVKYKLKVFNLTQMFSFVLYLILVYDLTSLSQAFVTIYTDYCTKYNCSSYLFYS